MNRRLPLLSMLCLFGLSFGDDEHGTASKSFNEESFAKDVSEKPHFVMFYAPW